ncbi:Protein O1, partial [Dissostichus eleginoides]
ILLTVIARITNPTLHLSEIYNMAVRISVDRALRLGVRQQADPTHDLTCKRSSAASCRQVSSFPHDTAIMVPSGWH